MKNKNLFLGLVFVSFVFILSGCNSNSPKELPVETKVTLEVTNATTETPTVTESPVVKTSPSVVVSDPKVGVYESKTLGITFSYQKESDGTKFAVKEDGDKIYVYPANFPDYKSGQWVQVMSKDKNLTLDDAVKQKFLANYSPNDCLVKSRQSSTGFKSVTISIPVNQNDGMEELSKKWDKCPAVYTTTNGISYFLMDPNHSDKFLYLSIGQYLIGSGVGKTGWQDTIKFL